MVSTNKRMNSLMHKVKFPFGRSEKTEVFSADLQQLKRQVDTIDHVCTLSKKGIKELNRCKESWRSQLPGSVGGGSTQPVEGGDMDRKMRKLAEMILSQHLSECSQELSTNDDHRLLANAFQDCAKCYHQLANRQMSYEQDLDRNVNQPIMSILEEIQKINHHRKQLEKLTEQMDASKSKYESAKRQSMSANIPNPKLEQLKEESVETLSKVELSRDQFSTEMFNFVAKESSLLYIIKSLIEIQATYHRESLEELDNLLPSIDQQIDEYCRKPVYGVSLDEHLQLTGQDIAIVIRTCVTALVELAMEEEGLFRIAGSAYKLKKLKAAFDAGLMDDITDYDIHCVAGALKSYLRELPEPLLTYDLYEEWVEASRIREDDYKLQKLSDCLMKLPQSNFNNFRYLIKFLAHLANNSDVNKMTPSNIGIVIGPNILWPRVEAIQGDLFGNTAMQSTIIETFISHVDYFFHQDDDLDLLPPLYSTSSHLVTVPAFGFTQSDAATKQHNEDLNVLNVSPGQKTSNDSNSGGSSNSLNSPDSTLKRKKKPAPPVPPALDPRPPPRSHGRLPPAVAPPPPPPPQSPLPEICIVTEPNTDIKPTHRRAGSLDLLNTKTQVQRSNSDLVGKSIPSQQLSSDNELDLVYEKRASEPEAGVVSYKPAIPDRPRLANSLQHKRLEQPPHNEREVADECIPSLPSLSTQHKPEKPPPPVRSGSNGKVPANTPPSRPSPSLRKKYMQPSATDELPEQTKL